MPSTDQWSRRTSHYKKCTCTANCFIGRHSGTGITFTRDFCVFSNHMKASGRRSLEIAVTITCGALGDHSSTPPIDDNRVRLWRPRGERLNPAFALQRPTAPTVVVMVWGDIAINTRSPPVLIRGTMTAQRYVHDILQPHVLPLMQRLQGAIFQQDIVRSHMVDVARLSPHCY
ncbi:uncharacterized protein TNCV_1599361 [Trichonephila clavipes]|nr:uncharacterized protein TNCV_1599361 [Trichonephila clavipes]